MAEQAVVTARQEFQRLDKELADALAAREQLRRLEIELAPATRLKQEIAALEQLQRAAAARQADEAQLAELSRGAATLETWQARSRAPTRPHTSSRSGSRRWSVWRRTSGRPGCGTVSTPRPSGPSSSSCTKK
jgi:hypothetical protein